MKTAVTSATFSNNKQPMDCDSQQAYSCQLLGVLGILISKLGHTDLVFGV